MQWNCLLTCKQEIRNNLATLPDPKILKYMDDYSYRNNKEAEE